MKILKIKYLIIFVVMAFFLQGCMDPSPVLVQVDSNDEPENAAASETVSEDIPENGTVFVHISGAVNMPGLYELDEGSRLYDAVCLAGGFSV